MYRRRISAATSRQAFGVVKYIRLMLVALVVVLALMVAGLWIYRPQLARLGLNQPARLAVDGVETVYELEGRPLEPGRKFLLVGIRIWGVGKMAQAVAPERFELETSTTEKHRALPESPLFASRGGSFTLKQGDQVSGQLAFEVPRDAEGRHLRFPVR